MDETVCHNWQAGHEPDEIEALREKVAELTEQNNLGDEIIKQLDAQNTNLQAQVAKTLAIANYDNQCELQEQLVAAQSRIKEVREMVERLRNDETNLFRLQEQAADLIERLAARVPDGCVVVPREPTEAMIRADIGFYEEHPSNMQAWAVISYKSMIAAGEVKP